VLAFAIMGNAVGDRWDEWQKNLHYVDYAIVAAIGAGIIYLLWRRRKNRAASATPLPDSPS
jgi:hypothetical protein